jgi:hypothetical protein
MGSAEEEGERRRTTGEELRATLTDLHRSLRVLRV